MSNRTTNFNHSTPNEPSSGSSSFVVSAGYSEPHFGRSARRGSADYLNAIQARATNFKGIKFNKLLQNLEARINRSYSHPIEYYESKLFDLSRAYHYQFPEITSKLALIATIHPLARLTEKDNLNQECWRVRLIQYLEYDIEAIKEAQFVKEFVKFLNDLALYWVIVDFSNYTHKFNKEIESLRFVNLRSLFSDMINIETIWLSYAALRYPLCEVVTEATKSLAKLLISQFKKTFEVFMESNKQHVKKYESIEPYLTKNNKNLCKDYNFAKPDKNFNPSFQRLKMQYWEVICKSKRHFLEAQLRDFERVYREFEMSLFESFYRIIRLEEFI